MAYIIEINSGDMQELAQCVGKMLKYGSKAMEHIERLQNEDSSSSYNERNMSYPEDRYNERSRMDGRYYNERHMGMGRYR